MRPQIMLLIAGCALVGCTLSGCASPAGDPFARPGTWNIGGDNNVNLAAMVANPADLQRGHGDGLAVGQTAVIAIERLRAGKVKPLPSSGVMELTPVNTSGASSGGASQ